MFSGFIVFSKQVLNRCLHILSYEWVFICLSFAPEYFRGFHFCLASNKVCLMLSTGFCISSLFRRSHMHTCAVYTQVSTVVQIPVLFLLLILILSRNRDLRTLYARECGLHVLSHRFVQILADYIYVHLRVYVYAYGIACILFITSPCATCTRPICLLYPMYSSYHQRCSTLYFSAIYASLHASDMLCNCQDLDEQDTKTSLTLFDVCGP